MFTSSFHLPNPFRYVARTTCLEAIFGLGQTELTYQLAVRGAWLLRPNAPDKKERLFEEIRELYSLRSKIVHGSRYKLHTFSDQEAKLLAITRQVLLKIIENPSIRRFYINGNQAECDKFLKGLSLGNVSMS